ncbi:MAG: UDP-2,3-diacylglucosamine diphosphatase LpxI [Elusimicrobia bacterium]|nr:UDP-2,3-diacylglucosamine diphosphatase LpxI [Elusimicrobiota bacterium]
MSDQPKKIGLIAGSGRFPLLFAEQAKRTGVEVLALGIKGVTDPALERLVSKLQFYPLGQIDKPIRFLKDEGVTEAVMAGKVQHSSLFGGVLPDFRAVKLLARLKDKRTDTILQAVAAEFAKDGIALLPSSTYLSHLLAEPGVLTRRKPTAAEAADMELGWKAAKALAGFDIGQSVVVRDGAIVAVEAMEGTDATIERAAQLAAAHGAKFGLVLVKVAKPRQDFRFDLPVVGLDTLKTLERCKVTALALEARKTLLFDKDEFLARADAMDVSIQAIEAAEPAAAGASPK